MYNFTTLVLFTIYGLTKIVNNKLVSVIKNLKSASIQLMIFFFRNAPIVNIILDCDKLFMLFEKRNKFAFN